MKQSPCLIKDYGSFQITDANVTICVWEDDGILQYSVDSMDGKPIIRSKEKASVYQWWVLYWSKDSELWVDSSDIGLFLWKKDDNGAYNQLTVHPESETLIRAIPEKLYAQMPQSDRRRWDKIRNAPSTTSSLPSDTKNNDKNNQATNKPDQ